MMEPPTKIAKTLHAYFSPIVFAAAILTFLPPALLNEAPFWDDKAYINNALIASGRINPSEAWGPFAEERPPLFWWLLTAIYLAGAPMEYARLVSPLLTSLTVTAIYLLTAKIFRSVAAGLVTSLAIIFLDYFVLTTSYILTDSLGSTLAFLTVLCFSMGLRYGPYMWAAGSLLAVSILARDQNLLLIPSLMLSMVWVAKTSKLLKLIALAALALTAFLTLSMTQEAFLQALSDIITPAIIDNFFPPLLGFSLLFGVLAVYKVHEQKNLLSEKPSLEERGLDMFLGVAICLVSLYPFFIDNVRLGDEFQIAGKGVLSRFVSHSMMVRAEIDKLGLNIFQRVAAWSSVSLKMLTLPLIFLAAAGCLLMLKNKITLAKPALVWLAVTAPYIFTLSHLEYRFLAQVVPAICFFAGYAVSRIAALNKTVGVALAVSLMFFICLPSNDGLTPSFQRPTAVVGWQALNTGSTSSERWLTDYSAYLQNVAKQPHLTMPLLNVLSACAVIPSVLAALYLGFRRGLLY